jgi:hypothetical protein
LKNALKPALEQLGREVTNGKSVSVQLFDVVMILKNAMGTFEIFSFHE